MFPVLNPYAAVLCCLTVIGLAARCLTVLCVVLVALRGSEPADRPAILRALTPVLRALADARRFWR